MIIIIIIMIIIIIIIMIIIITIIMTSTVPTRSEMPSEYAGLEVSARTASYGFHLRNLVSCLKRLKCVQPFRFTHMTIRFTNISMWMGNSN